MNRTPLSLSLTLAAMLVTHGAVAQPTRVDHVQAGYQHVKIGAVDVITLSDGTLPIPADKLLINVKPGEVAATLARTYQSTDVDASINTFLMQLGDRLVMVDAGTGELFGPKLNKLGASMRAAGYKPEDVTDILITHIHTDHTGGLMDGSRMVFPNATLHIARQEVDYWLSAQQRARAPEAARKYFDEAALKVQPYVDAGKVQTFSGATQLFPGMRALPAPGHTPGHTFYSLESGDAKVVFVGDLLHVADVQLPRPDVTIAFDVDPAMAAATRKRALADAVAGRYWMAADHVAFPGIGHVQTDSKGYRWIPAPYINDYYKAK
jgi:glyoxylase-like metal-dependent hydrolase (beta-lactamase superfamily II)